MIDPEWLSALLNRHNQKVYEMVEIVNTPIDTELFNQELSSYGKIIRLTEDGEDQIAEVTHSELDANRLVSCWNLCIGIPTHTLNDYELVHKDSKIK